MADKAPHPKKNPSVDIGKRVDPTADPLDLSRKQRQLRTRQRAVERSLRRGNFSAKKTVFDNRKWNDQAWLVSHPSRYFHIPQNDYSRSYSIEYKEDRSLGTLGLIDQFLKLGSQELSLLQPYFQLEKLHNGKPKPYKPVLQEHPKDMPLDLGISTPLRFTTID